MREIQVDKIAQAVHDLCLGANYVTGDDVRHALEMASTHEASPLGQILENMAIADNDRVPRCQDLGVAPGG